MAEKQSIQDPWAFWMSGPSAALENEAVTRALQISLSSDSNSNSNSNSSAVEALSSAAATPSSSSASSFLFARPDPPAVSSPPEAPAQGQAVGPRAGKIGKRKPRASRRLPTTYINADAANFRAMVQQVTGVQLGGGGPGLLPVEPVLKPEPQRANRFVMQSGAVGAQCLPTLDTSALVLDRAGPAEEEAEGSFAPVVDGPVVFDFESFLNFPTLESWGVM